MKLRGGLVAVDRETTLRKKTADKKQLAIKEIEYDLQQMYTSLMHKNITKNVVCQMTTGEIKVIITSQAKNVQSSRKKKTLRNERVLKSTKV